MAGGAPAGSGGEAATESLIDILQSLLRELPGLVSDRVELFTLELARAGAALGRLVGWLVAIAIVGVTAWLALWAALVAGLVQLGLHWTLAVLLVAVVNLAAVGVGVQQVRRLAGQLSLPATRRHLTRFGAAALPPAPFVAPAAAGDRHAGAPPAAPLAR